MNSLPGPRPALALLPDDIICELFQALEKIDVPRARTIRKRSRDPGERPDTSSIGWIRLTHVSRRLRNLGIDYLPTLWARTTCVFPKPHAWNTTLERSRSVPLTLDLTVPRLLELIPLPAHVIRRARSIRHFVHRDHPAERRWWNDAPLPTLESLTLSYDWFYWSTEEDELVGSHYPTGCISAPALISYKTDACFVSFRAPSLRCLTLGHPVMRTTLMECLRSCPLLERLTIRDTHESVDSRPGAALKITLPHLKYLSLTWPTDAVGVCKFVDSLSISPTTPVYGSHCRSSDIFRHLLDIRRSKFGSGSGDVLRILTDTVDYNRPELLRVDIKKCGWRSEHESYEALQSWTLDTDYGVEERETLGLATILGKAFSPSLALDIRVLAFHDSYSPASTDPLDNALRAFTAVTALYVQRHNVLPILALLRVSSENIEGVSDALFPELKTLLLDVTTERLTKSEWKDVLDLLTNRKAGGYPLETLVLMGTHLCHLSPDMDSRVKKKTRINLRPVKALVGEVVDLRGGKGCTCGK